MVHGEQVQDLGRGGKDHGPRGGDMEVAVELEEAITCGSLLKKGQGMD